MQLQVTLALMELICLRHTMSWDCTLVPCVNPTWLTPATCPCHQATAATVEMWRQEAPKFPWTLTQWKWWNPSHQNAAGCCWVPLWSMLVPMMPRMSMIMVRWSPLFNVHLCYCEPLQRQLFQIAAVRRAQRCTGLTYYFNFWHSGTQDWAPERPNVKNWKWGWDQYRKV